MRAIWLSALCFFMLAVSAQAAAKITAFKDTTGDGKMSTAGNWDFGLPVNGDTIIFSSNGASGLSFVVDNDLGSANQFAMVSFTGTNCTWKLTGFSITTPQIYAQATGSTVRIECPLVIASVGALDSNGYGFNPNLSGAGTFELAGQISGTPAGDVTFFGALVKFRAANTLAPTGAYVLAGNADVGHTGCFATTQKVSVGNTYNVTLSTDMNCGNFNHPGGGGTITLNGKLMNIGAGSAAASFIGANVDAGTNGKIVKTGTGSLQVEKFTTVGTLDVDGGTTTVKPNNGNLNIRVLSNGTLDLSNANIGPYKSIAGVGGIVKLAASSPVVVESFTMSNSSTLQLFGGQPIAASGTVFIDTSILNTTGVSSLANGASLDIATFPVQSTGTFAGLGDLATLTLGVSPAYIHYLNNKISLVGGAPSGGGPQAPVVTVTLTHEISTDPDRDPDFSYTDLAVYATIKVSGTNGLATGTLDVTTSSSLVVQTLTLNASGAAVFTFQPIVSDGLFTVFVSYNGDSNYLAADKNQAIDVSKVNTEISIAKPNSNLFTPAPVGKQWELTAGANSVVAGKIRIVGYSPKYFPSGTVTIEFLGKTTQLALDGVGLVSFELTDAPFFQKAPLPLKITYPGDAVHKACAAELMVVFPSDADKDGDGFTDAFESGAGTDANDSASFPGSDSDSVQNTPAILLLQLNLDFKTNTKNTSKFVFTIPANGNFDPVTGIVVIDVGPIEQVFNIGDDGKLVAPEKGDKLKITVDKRNDALKVAGEMFGLKKATKDELAAAGYNDANIKVPEKHKLKLLAVIRRVFFGFDADMLFKANKGKTGKATLEKKK